MKANASARFEKLWEIVASFKPGGTARRHPGEEAPLRAELFSTEQMQQHGRVLAASHQLTTRRAPNQLLARLAANEEVLIDACNLLTAAVKANRRISLAGEWLLDNFYLIEEQIRTAKRHLPKGYSRELPLLETGPSAGLPRVYDIALETISHGDGRVDPESLTRFVASYQSVTPLKLGELWAIPIMLRLALIENLRRVAARIANDGVERNLADLWADQMTEVAEQDPKNLILVIADMARSNPPMTTSFVSELARRLQGQSPALALPLTWIEQRLAESSLTIQQLVQLGNQQQAADQVSISNSIGSLRFLSAMDWRDFVETMSVVEQKLREDPDGTYAGMEFATRDRYRHVIEEIAKGSHLSESDVARKAIQLAHEAAASQAAGQASADARVAHVGFYLFDKGRPRLEQAVGTRLTPMQRVRRTAERFPLLLYLSSIALITFALTAGFVAKARIDGATYGLLAVIGLLALIATSHVAVLLVNWMATVLVKPLPLPRMDFTRGVPAQWRTLVAVPTMLASEKSVVGLVEALEVRFLANRDDNLRFALLTDFIDAPRETMPDDEALLHLAEAKIEALNEKYATPHPERRNDIFFLLHRPRRFNPREKIWMGYERKRGKLADLNALLRGGAREAFSRIVGDVAALADVKYVITLDSDTQLPRESARAFVGSMAHPLNRPRFDENRRIVVEGYAILQPSVAVSLPGSNRSLYARLHGGDAGIDPYTRAISDVYQDVFGEGSFIGKGIYDVDAFEHALAGRFPENQILSHDLLEGSYARSGLLSDVQLVEDFPARYHADVARRHRWIRGDWQIFGWLMPRVPGFGGKRERNPLSFLSQWKIFDNLRRSLVAPAITLLMLIGWVVLAWDEYWTLALAAIVLLPSFNASILDFARKRSDVLLRQHVSGALRATARHAAQGVLALACFPHEAAYSLDAIARTVTRMLLTRRRLLEWSPSGDADEGAYAAPVLSLYQMWFGPVLAIGAAAYLWRTMPVVLAVAAPILVLWLASPLAAWWISRPRTRRQTRLSTDETLFLRQVARKTWAFFDTFVGPDDHWLPPDNHQEHPIVVTAHRTSPTNMGMALLANIAAYDFGYLHAGDAIARTANTLRTMRSLERHQGHFYNWYDTLSLAPLPPLYISSVDSGNLAAHLLTLRGALCALPDDRILRTRLLEGLADTLRIAIAAGRRTDSPLLTRLQRDLESAYDSGLASVAAAKRWLDRLGKSIDEIAAQPADAHGGGDEAAPAESEAAWWTRALVRQFQTLADEIAFLLPWTALPEPPRALADLPRFAGIPTLRELAELDVAAAIGESAQHAKAGREEREWLEALGNALQEGKRRAGERIVLVDRLIREAGELATMEYGFLYDSARHLLSIGYNVAERRQDPSYYDLLASEARLSCYVAIAQGQLPQEAWFALSRLLTTVGGEPTLLSWSGSMFEYLMPLLVMPTYENALLDQTYKTAVERQIEYGAQRGVPWGMSESGYNAVDASLNYQYRAFGVPGLGLKRGLAEDLVIAPYATVLALMVAPEAACRNLQRLAGEGTAGRYGFFEAVDYTPSRLPRGQSAAIVRSFMSHHQGMSLLSLAYLLLDQPMQKRFEFDPEFRATLLLLQERVPQATTYFPHTAQLSDVRATPETAELPVRVLTSPDTPVPEVGLLSNGQYHVMVTNAGSGSSRWRDFAVTRWREDGTSDNWGTFCYIRELASGEFWSVAHQPTLKRADHYEAIFSEGRAEFRRRDHGFDTYTEIVVSPEDDIELRRVRIINRSRNRRTIDVTSYAEVVLAPAAADAMHPAFSNLFVQTEIIEERQAIVCTRRPRSLEEHTPWMFHLMAAHGAVVGSVSYETDRMKFIGRGNTVAQPLAMTGGEPLSGSKGSVLDPIAAIRYQLALEPEETVTVDLVSGIGATREAVLGLIEKYHDRRLADRVFELAWTHSQVVLRQINATDADSQLYGRLANSILYANASLRAEAAIIAKNRRGQSGLWGYAISGDLPIVLLRIADIGNIDLVRQLVQAHAYWRLKGLAVDLVIWNEDHAGYRQLLHDQIMGLIAAGVEAHVIERPGGIFVRRAEQMSEEDRILIQSVARVIITDGRGTLTEQVNRRAAPDVRIPRFTPTRIHRPELPATLDVRRSDLVLANGTGGFTADGTEYVITTTRERTTPLPWVNVIANPQFGCVISESGGAYTWRENAHEFRLTPWQNDPVTDACGEAFYLRDEETGYYWSPTPLPCRGTGAYCSRHGFGYSVFEHTENGVATELTVFVAIDASVKFCVLKVANQSGRPRRISATGYVEWVMGDMAAKSAMHVVTAIAPDSGAILARNSYNTEFVDRVAFFDVDDATRTVTGDRVEFLGRNGSPRSPAAMGRTRLSGRIGAALDPCAAMQVVFDLAEGQSREIVFRLGAGQDSADVGRLVLRFKGAAAARTALENVRRHWRNTLGAVQVETPDVAFNLLANGWLLYQVIACRVWGRSGYYQSGGAFGFRDQLQDVMALIHAAPHLLRDQIVLCAGRQFPEGDVQHWWHPPSGRGVRTRCSDDYLWLPFAACRYVLGTGDTSVLDESAQFLEGRSMNSGEDSYYDLPGRSDETATVYQHCVRAILYGLRFGERGLPLMGSGDWNDGMNLVGIHGQGESVWLGFFLCEVLSEFAKVARLRGDDAFAERCEVESARLHQSIERHAWDGAWYRRAYFDDGTPLGSSTNAECQIDSIAQSWSVLSGAANSRRSRRAMNALYQHLVRRDAQLIQLLDPPFDKSSLNPGYIIGYVPGVRENGGQYTHSAIWATMAFAALGDRERAWELASMINPARHAATEEAVATYKAEPYVVAADVYAVAPHTGRGGWTWYTGSAGWMYRLMLESLLGIRLDIDRLIIAPCLPADWSELRIHYRYRATSYRIDLSQTGTGREEREAVRVSFDGAEQADATVPLVDDGGEHVVTVVVSKAAVAKRVAVSQAT